MESEKGMTIDFVAKNRLIITDDDSSVPETHLHQYLVEYIQENNEELNRIMANRIIMDVIEDNAREVTEKIPNIYGRMAIQAFENNLSTVQMNKITT